MGDLAELPIARIEQELAGPLPRACRQSKRHQSDGFGVLGICGGFSAGPAGNPGSPAARWRACSFRRCRLARNASARRAFWFDFGLSRLMGPSMAALTDCRNRRKCFVPIIGVT